MSRGVDALPGGWAATNLAAVGDLVTGMTPSTKQEGFHGGGIPFVKPGDLDGDQPLMRSTDTVSVEGAAQGRLLPVDSVLVSCIGNLGKTAILGVPAISNQQINAIVPGPAVVPKYILHFCRTLRPWMDANASATTITILNKGRFGTAPVRVAPLNEQRRIVAKIEALQARATAAKEAFDAIPPLLEKFRQSVLAAAFRGDLTREWREAHPDVEPAAKLLERIRAERKRRWVEANPKKAYVEPEPVDTEGLPEMPGGWCWVAASEIVEPGADIIYGIVQPGPPLDDGVPYVRGTDIQDGTILVDQLWRTSREIANDYSRSTIRAGDVRLCIIRHLKVAVVPQALDGGNLSRTTARLRPSVLVKTHYLADALRSPFCQGWLKANYRGGTSMPKVNIGDAVRLPIPLAPLAEQAAVAAKLVSLFDGFRVFVEAARASSAVHASLTQSILSKAFRGELVPQDPNDEPASALLERIRRERDGQGAPAAKRGRKPASRT